MLPPAPASICRFLDLATLFSLCFFFVFSFFSFFSFLSLSFFFLLLLSPWQSARAAPADDGGDHAGDRILDRHALHRFFPARKRFHQLLRGLQKNKKNNLSTSHRKSITIRIALRTWKAFGTLEERESEK